MSQLPFTLYDFFGYLAAGFTLLVAVVAAFEGAHELAWEPSILQGLVVVLVAYVLGHLVANLAGYLVERLLVGRVLGRPTVHLIGPPATDVGSKRRCVFPGYFTPLPGDIQKRILSRAREEAGLTKADEALFFHCHARVKSNAVAWERMETFLNLYGFCRNIALSLSLAALVLLIGVWEGSAETGAIPPGWWVAGAIVGAVAMLYRYLKFHRQYAVELFTTYSGGSPCR